MKGMTILVCLSQLIVSIVYVVRLFPVRGQSSTFVLHSNVYLGIDDVRTFAWAFLPLAIWVGCTFVDLVIAYGSFRNDLQFSLSLALLACVWSVPWIIGLSYLLRLNV